jgi:hypothetical protein
MAWGEAPRCDGRLAQLGERCLRKAEVGSSNLLPSIRKNNELYPLGQLSKLLKDGLRTVCPTLGIKRW